MYGVCEAVAVNDAECLGYLRDLLILIRGCRGPDREELAAKIQALRVDLGCDSF